MAKTHARTAYDKLNPMQKKFVDEYLIDFNATQAYIRAGYAPNDSHASRLAGKGRISAAISERMDTHGITAERIASGLAGIAWGDQPSKRVTGSNPHSEQDRLSALDKLSKIRGMVTERQQVEQVGPVRVMFDDGTPAERAAAAGEAAAERRRAAEVNR